MGADRKGPLAAFVVIAIIAAILLVTSVRSQAEPSIVASPPAPSGPDVWTQVGDELGWVVQAGESLVHRATADPTRVGDPTVTSAAEGTSLPVGTHPVAHSVAPVVRHRPARPTVPPVAHESTPVTTPVTTLATTSAPTPTTSSPAATGPGRHLGWANGGAHGGSHGGAHGGTHGRHLGWAKHGS